VWVTGTQSQDWLSSLGDRVHKYEKQRYIASWIATLLLAGIPAALANQTDGATVTVVAQTDPLDKYRGATELSSDELIDMLSLVGFKGTSLRTAWAVVMKESRGHPTSRNNTVATGDNSYGLFQINMFGSLGENRREKFGIKTNSELFDPVTNAQAAFYMTAGGKNWGSWGYGPDAYDGDPAEPSITNWLDKFPTK